MGIGFTIDTPVKVAHYGISSVVSLVDDILIEKMRAFYCEKLNIPFQEISDKIEDFRAKRITAYLNLMDKIVDEKFTELKKSILEKGPEIEKYMDMLPDFASIKEKFRELTEGDYQPKEVWEWVKANLTPGSIDVNIMTKLDKVNFLKKEKLPTEFNDAHAALRGFAESNLRSSIILSAGLNARLFSYFEQFKDFFPDKTGDIKKKIILKVSDFRSAMIQGKVFAKKGLWVSEYRIESGLNCGGHAFATDGFLMGPILEEFKNKRGELVQKLHDILVSSLKEKDRFIPDEPMPVKITAQGGVGTAEEHQLLLDYYNLDSVGWGTPFLLVPEATNVDGHTRGLLEKAKEEDLYLSNISPLGVPFNSLKGNTKDLMKEAKIEKGKPGSPCPKKYLVSNTEFTERAICVASRQYQKNKISLLEQTHGRQNGFQKEYDKVVDKSCICVGLGTSALLENNLDHKVEGPGVSICSGPNMAYFSETVSLKKMVAHIYGKAKLVKRNDRPNMFIKELEMYLDYLKNKIDEVSGPLAEKQKKYFLSFQENLDEGINYYKESFSTLLDKFGDTKSGFITNLENLKNRLNSIKVS
ncbi:MAG: hypothetical protein D8M58_10875 [Calditrichaeota bacterium]|nr:MAG: hypothetical protein DWQ03_10250 [Calditrichota bacterium]MBL1205895.1 hypothetical protein [Calditrichota bacterium]NOG45723.1 hypothetical protein [Calditrichota bacterium]